MKEKLAQRKQTKACEVICSVIALKDGEKLFQAIRQPTANDLDEPIEDFIALMSAYRGAMTKNVKIQILSIYAYWYTMKLSQKFHEPYEKISLRQINRARLLKGNEDRDQMSRKYSAIDYVWTQASRPLYRFCKPSLFLPRRRLWNANTDLRWGTQNNDGKRNPERDQIDHNYVVPSTLQRRII